VSSLKAYLSLIGISFIAIYIGQRLPFLEEEKRATPSRNINLKYI